ncbi:MAG: acyl-CoA dehydrogenase [Rhodospirillaceae bacterium]|nr:MAG: acyl-CoA dehydrogenase [Rhodospirillaceae bacterium]
MISTNTNAMSRRFAPLDKRGDLDAFRAELRAWLSATVPVDWPQKMEGADTASYVAFQRWWIGEMRKVDLATPHWPREWGGEDISLSQQIVVSEEMARANAPDPDLFTISLYHLPATLFGHGTTEQRERYLRGAKEGRDIWCQGFSEPNAGSDLASLRTRAERKGSAYVVNGQKIWSSFGMFADYCLLLARTNPNAQKKQAGISYFILDMKSPGVTVRAIRQITGEAEFSEIFFDDVEIPAENLIGQENEGWTIAQSTLSAERGLIVFNQAEKLARAFDRDFQLGKGSWAHDHQFRREFGLLHARMRALRILIRRMLTEIERNPEMGGAVITTFIKLHWATLLQDYTAFLLRAEGAGTLALRPSVLGGGSNTGLRVNDFLRSYAWTISGGTNEIMRNIIAERVLGMPRG